MPLQKKTIAQWAAIVVAASLLLFGGGHYWLRTRYPYGCKHICNKAVGLALMQYALDHQGHFPAGKGSPEASFSLLYHEKYIGSSELLAGKTASGKQAEAILSKGGSLDPATCSWIYVEGLMQDDPSDIAILYDKVGGLGHNCELLSDGGHEVVYVAGNTGFIPAAEWNSFLFQQNKLISETLNKRLQEKVKPDRIAPADSRGRNL